MKEAIRGGFPVSIARNAYFLAVLIHLAAFGTLAIYTVRPTVVPSQPSKQSQPSTSVSTPQAGGFSAVNAPFQMSQLQAKLTASLAAAQSWSPTEQLGAANDYASKIESISSVSSMKEMGTYLRTTVSWKAPVSQAEPGKEKAFDHATSTPVGAKRQADGRYVFVFKDANNNLCELPASPGDEHAAKAMALLDRSEVLRELKDGILLPMLNQRLDAR
jgi:hypothetical protein